VNGVFSPLLRPFYMLICVFVEQDHKVVGNKTQVWG